MSQCEEENSAVRRILLPSFLAFLLVKFGNEGTLLPDFLPRITIVFESFVPEGIQIPFGSLKN